MGSFDKILSHFNVSRETLGNLKEFAKLLLKWNKTINLIGKNTESEIWERHIIDCLQLITCITNKNIHLIDLGSGAGLPGIVLSIAGVQRTTLIESDSRKCAFLKEASKISPKRLEVVNDRIENIHMDGDIITSRACAELDKLFFYISRFKIHDKIILLKGINIDSEIKKAVINWNFDIKKYNGITLDSYILEITNLSLRK